MLDFYLNVIFYPFWRIYLASGLIGSIVSGLVLLEERGTIFLFTEESEMTGVLILFGLFSFLNSTRSGLLTYLRHKSYIKTVSYFFDNVCLKKLEHWDLYYDKLELTKCIHTDISAFVDTTIKIYGIIIRNLVSTILLFYFLIKERYEYLLFAIFICVMRSYFLENLVKYWGEKSDKVKEVKNVTEKYLTEFVSNNVSMQIYGLGDIYKLFINQSLVEYDFAQIDDTLWYSIFIFSFVFLMRFINVGVYFICLTFEKMPSFTEIQVTLNYFRVLSDSVQSLSDIGKEWKNNKDSIHRLSKYLKYDQKVPSSLLPKATINKVLQKDDSNIIHFDNITFSYPTRDSEVLMNFNLKIKPGETIVLKGESGKGKTTLIKLLLGLYKPNKGSVFINGKPSFDMTIKQIRKHISIIPQEPIIFENKTLRENLELFSFKKTSLKKIEKVLQLVELKDMIPFLNDKLTCLSGGQKQRLSIARILVSNAPIIVLDEAFSAMDHVLKNKMKKIVFRHIKNQQKTVIMITHDTTTFNFKTIHI